MGKSKGKHRKNNGVGRVNTDGRDIIRQAVNQGAVVDRFNGDHAILKKPGVPGSVSCPNRVLGTGLACTVIKQLRRLFGIIILVLTAIFGCREA